MTLTIDFVPHMDAGDRKAWQGDQNQRPLSELGRRQSEAMADALATGPIDALYASPALRCSQTLQPVASRRGLSMTVLAELGERSWLPPEGWSGGTSDALAAAYACGRAISGIERVRAEHTQGRAIVCSHGHIIPALVAFLIGAHNLADVPEIAERGQWYQARFENDRIQVALLRAPEQFPK